MIDVTRRGANHVQVFRAAGLSVHSVLLTVNEALELMDKLKRALEDERQIEAFIADD